MQDPLRNHEALTRHELEGHSIDVDEAEEAHGIR